MLSTSVINHSVIDGTFQVLYSTVGNILLLCRCSWFLFKPLYRKLFKKCKAKDGSKRSTNKTGNRSRRFTQSRTPPSSSRASRDTRKQQSRRRSERPGARQEGTSYRGSEKVRVGDQPTKLKACHSAYSSSRTKDDCAEKGQAKERKKNSRGQRGGESEDTGRTLTSKDLKCRYDRDSPHAQRIRGKASRKGLNSPQRQSPAVHGSAGAACNTMKKERTIRTNEKEIDDILHSVLSSRTVRSVGDDGVPQDRKGVQEGGKKVLKGETSEYTMDFEREPGKLLKPSSASRAQKDGISISSSARASPPGTHSREGKLHRNRRADEIKTSTKSDQRKGQTKGRSPLNVKREIRKTRSGHEASSHSLNDELLDISVSEETIAGNDGYHTGGRAQGNQLVKANDSGEAVLPIGGISLIKKQDDRSFVMVTGTNAQKDGSFSTAELGAKKEKIKEMTFHREKEENKAREVAIWEHVDVEVPYLLGRETWTISK